MTLYKGKAVIEIEVEAINEITAVQKFEADMRGTFNGVRKSIFIRPNFEERKDGED